MAARRRRFGNVRKLPSGRYQSSYLGPDGQRRTAPDAVREGAILRNPCTLPGAGADHAKERPTATPVQIVALVDAITPRYRAAVLIAAWGGLRRGEIVVGLHREDVDLAAGTVRVRRSR